MVVEFETARGTTKRLCSGWECANSPPTSLRCRGLTLPWSIGQAEGQITRLKLLKRAMYGRANLDLLRRRFLLAA
ncbi:hypothetical protein MBTS_03350 [Methylobacterium bullatum]|nr:hypothetical protein [Methylobacterium bullatum]